MKYKYYGLTLESDFIFSELNESMSQTDIFIKKMSVKLPKTTRTTLRRGGVLAHFGGYFPKSYISWENVADYEAEAGILLNINPKIEESGRLNLYTLSEALGMVLFQRNYFLVHASAVEINGAATLFMGMPGAGKSTTTAAFVKHGYKLLADDMVAIKYDDNGMPMVVPAFPQLKIWESTVQGLGYDKSKLTPCFEGATKYAFRPSGEYSYEPVPLKKIIYLHRSNRYPATYQIPRLQMPVDLVKYFPLPPRLLDSERLKWHFENALKITKFTENIRIRRPSTYEKLKSFVETYK